MVIFFTPIAMIGGEMSMVGLNQYGMVRVRQLLHAPEYYDGWRLNQRTPLVGDKGCIVDILHAPGLPDRYVVECSGLDGVDIWLADFSPEELEALPDK